MPLSLLFTGHMVDLPSRPRTRFPPSLEEVLKREIRQRIERQLETSPALDTAGFASGARGGDILFHEICREMKIKTAIVLPFPAERFVRTSVAGVPNSNWETRFWNLWYDKAHMLLSEEMGLPETEHAYRACNTRLIELAKEHGRVHLIAFWDGKEGAGPGGTADLVAQAEHVGDKPDIFSPEQVKHGRGG
jgi:hypothetical protein